MLKALIIFCLFVFFVVYIFVLYKKIQRNIKQAVSPHFVNISPTTHQFKELIIAVYNLQKHTDKLLKENNLDDKSRPIKSNFAKIASVFKTLGFEIIDYSNQKYNDGMNIDVVSTICSNVPQDIIKETIEPSIIYNGELLSRAKVIKEISGEKDE